MNVSLPVSVTGSATELATSATPPRSQRAAREFEASLIASLLASLEKTFSAVPGDDTLPGSDDYNYLGTRALADGLVAHGGFGIAKLISSYLASHESKGGRRDERVEESPAPPAKVSATPADRTR